MMADDPAKILHDKATRGESLSEAEQSLLTQWYTLQDSLESNLLERSSTEKLPGNLPAQIEAALARLMTATQRIQEIAAENERLRGEIAHLRDQVVQRSRPQVA